MWLAEQARGTASRRPSLAGSGCRSVWPSRRIAAGGGIARYAGARRRCRGRDGRAVPGGVDDGRCRIGCRAGWRSRLLAWRLQLSWSHAAAERLGRGCLRPSRWSCATWRRSRCWARRCTRGTAGCPPRSSRRTERSTLGSWSNRTSTPFEWRRCCSRSPRSRRSRSRCGRAAPQRQRAQGGLVMNRLGRLALVMALVASLGLASACQRTVEVQTGTRIVDSQGRVISEDIKTRPRSARDGRRLPHQHHRAARRRPSPQVAALYAEAQTRDRRRRPQARRDEARRGHRGLAELRQRQEAVGSDQGRQEGHAGHHAVQPLDLDRQAQADRPPKPTVDTASKLLRWMPDVLDGFTARKPAVDPLSVSREYKPGAGNPAATFVIVAEQFRTSADAKRGAHGQREAALPQQRELVDGPRPLRLLRNRRAAVRGRRLHERRDHGRARGVARLGSPSAMKSVLEKVLRQLP